MVMLKQQFVEVEGATLEVFSGGHGGPIVCAAHPFVIQTEHGGVLSELSSLVLINPRGSGNSSPAQCPSDYSWAQLIDDIEAVRHHLGVHRWAFAGYSGGGNVGLLY